MCLNPQRIKMQFVACGKCLECRIKKSTEWAYRVTHEAKNYKDNCMITLTYNNDNLPLGSTLVKSDLQKFLKRLRKHLKTQKIRYFACGEYGDRRGRPHYHIIIFNYKPTDLVFFKRDNKGTLLYRSKEIEKLWPFGFSSVGEVNFDSAKYCAIYLQKPLEDVYKVKPFVTMSKKPGLAFNSIKPNLLNSDKLYLDGKYISLPRYFLKVYEREGFDLTVLKNKRLERGYPTSSEGIVLQIEEVKKRIKKYEKIFGKALDKSKMI